MNDPAMREPPAPAEEKPVQAFIDWPEELLKTKIREVGRSPRLGLTYADLLAELDRRAANRQAKWAMVLSAVGAIIATLAVIVTALKP